MLCMYYLYWKRALCRKQIKNFFKNQAGVSPDVRIVPWYSTERQCPVHGSRAVVTAPNIMLTHIKETIKCYGNQVEKAMLSRT